MRDELLDHLTGIWEDVALQLLESFKGGEGSGNPNQARDDRGRWTSTGPSATEVFVKVQVGRLTGLPFPKRWIPTLGPGGLAPSDLGEASIWVRMLYGPKTPQEAEQWLTNYATYLVYNAKYPASKPAPIEVIGKVSPPMELRDLLGPSAKNKLNLRFVNGEIKDLERIFKEYPDYPPDKLIALVREKVRPEPPPKPK